MSRNLLPSVTHAFAFAKEGLPKLQPFEFRLEESLSLPYALHVSLIAKDLSLDESKLVGEACTLTVMRGGPGALVRHINGLVARATFHAVPLDLMTPEGTLPTGSVDLLVVPALWALGQRSNNRIFQSMKAPAILKEVLDEALRPYGRKVTLKTTDSKYPELEYCTQYDETDLDFVQRLMATHGIMSYFNQGEKEEELILFDDASNYLELSTLDFGKVPFEASQTGSATVETVGTFEMGTKMTPTSATVRVFNWSAGGRPDETPESSQDAQGRDRELYYGESPVMLGDLDGEGGLYKKTTAGFQVKLIQQTELAQRCLAMGGGVVTGMTPGMTFDLDNAQRDELNQKYLIVGVTHHGRRPGDASKGSFAGHDDEVLYSNSFVCVPKDVLFRLARPPRRAVQTVQTAIVVGEEDVSTDTHGRIKVQFHWDRKGKNDSRSSCWMRVAQFSAGANFGAVFIPRRGQEVVVTFLEGDPDKPLVVGSLYNGTHLTPYDLSGKTKGKRHSKTRSVIRTRSTPGSEGYNEISFEDAKDSEELFIQAQKDLNEVVKHDHELVVANDEVLRVGDDSKGGKTTKGNRTRSVKNDETIDIGGNREKTVEKDETLNVHGNRTRYVKHDEKLTIDDNRALKVGKNDAVDIGGTHEMAVAKAVTQTYKSTHACNVTGHQDLSAKSKTENIKEGYELNTKKKYQLAQGGTVFELKDDKVVLKAGASIKIYHDKGAVEVTSDGNVKITGAQEIKLEAGSSKLSFKGGKAALSSDAIDIG